nr:MAG TPA: hypothetical protein [Caudoviricetes sp.]
MIAKTVIMRNHRFTPTSLVLSRIPDDTVLVEWCVKTCQRQTIHNLD